jgi:YkoY family integral membrane protein
VLQIAFTVGFLIFLEGLLSFDNAIVLALVVKQLPQDQQKKALTYGIWGAFLFRFLALFCLTFFIHFVWIKVLGALYLLKLSYDHFYKKEDDEDQDINPKPGFWSVVLSVELMDIAFSMDSILASVGVSSELWVVFTGGVLGIIMMRFAASLFVKLIDRFPKLEESAFYLITVIGIKMLIEACQFRYINFHDTGNAAFWTYWLEMLIALIAGFRR